MEGSSVKKDRNTCNGGYEKYKRAHVVLRVMAALATLAAAFLLGFSRQTSDIAGFQLEASYKSSSAFKFFLVGNAIAGGYSLISLMCVSQLVKGYVLDVLDLMSLGLVMAAAAAASAIGYLGKKGNDQTGWAKVCPYYEKFCDRVLLSVACSYIGILLFLIICALSSVYKTRQICYA